MKWYKKMNYNLNIRTCFEQNRLLTYLLPFYFNTCQICAVFITAMWLHWILHTLMTRNEAKKKKTFLNICKHLLKWIMKNACMMFRNTYNIIRTFCNWKHTNLHILYASLTLLYLKLIYVSNYGYHIVASTVYNWNLVNLFYR